MEVIYNLLLSKMKSESVLPNHENNNIVEFNSILNTIPRGEFNLNYQVDGKNLLHQAVLNTCIPFIELLIENGVDSNFPDSNGWVSIQRHL